MLTASVTETIAVFINTSPSSIRSIASTFAFVSLTDLTVTTPVVNAFKVSTFALVTASVLSVSMVAAVIAIPAVS